MLLKGNASQASTVSTKFIYCLHGLLSFILFSGHIKCFFFGIVYQMELGNISQLVKHQNCVMTCSPFKLELLSCSLFICFSKIEVKFRFLLWCKSLCFSFEAFHLRPHCIASLSVLDYIWET